MKEIISNPELVAYCGFYCGACKSYLKDKCPGCHENRKASWCKVRTCCIDSKYTTCADCKQITDPLDCGKYNNFMSKIFGMVFRSDRAACIRQIREIGLQGHAESMAQQKQHSIKR